MNLARTLFRNPGGIAKLHRRPPAVERVVAFLLAGVVLAATTQAATLSPAETRGKQIYLHGTSPSGQDVGAWIGLELMRLPAAAVPCASCHGADGYGRPEGGVIPTPITWGYLTKRYGHSHPYGRRHAAFDEASLGKAITTGIDPAGNRFDPAMPLYEMPQQDLADLIAYMKLLETEVDPGLSEARVRLGTLLPRQGPLTRLAQAMHGVMQAYFDEINARGGIYGRHLDLVVIDSAGDPDHGLGELRRLLAEDPVFALVSAFSAGAEAEIATLTEREKLPLIGPFTLFPQESFTLNRFTFYLFGGLREQARALVEHAATGLGLKNPRVAVIHPSSEGYAEIANAVDQQGKEHGWTAVTKLAYAPGELDPTRLARTLHEEGTEAVFFLGSEQELGWLRREAARVGWTPYLLLPASLAGRDLLDSPDGFQDRIFLAYPTLPADRTRKGLRELQDLRERHPIGARHGVAQISAFSAAKLLVEGLKRTGKDLSREKLVSVLEGLHEFEPGLTPAISYGANRRIGALGAHIVTVKVAEKRFAPVGSWISLD